MIIFIISKMIVKNIRACIEINVLQNNHSNLLTIFFSFDITLDVILC
jgi:hypothetical protein